MPSNTALLLHSAARECLLRYGVAGSSARGIAELAGATPSAINYAFGGIKHLFGAVFEHGIHETEAFLVEIEAELDLWPSRPATAAAVLEGLLIRWVTTPNGLSALYQQALASRHDAPHAVEAWLKLWSEFFAKLAKRHGLNGRQGELMNLLFQSEALYALSCWRPMLERAALGDVVRHFGALWLGGAPSCPTGALAAAEAAVRLPIDRPLDGPALTMMHAAVEVVAERGLSGLTHRAVAAKCNVTAGAVAHYYRSAAALMAAAIKGQVLALQQHAGATLKLQSITTLDDFVQTLAAGAVTPQSAATVRARRNLFLASLTDPAHAQAGAAVRFAAGATIREAVKGALPGDPCADLHASVLSRLLGAIAVTADTSDASVTTSISENILQGFVEGVN